MASKKQLILAKCYDKKGNLLSTAFNSYRKTHPKQKEFAVAAGMPFREYLHAEIHAMIRARGKDIHKLTVERYDSNGKASLARPCPVCDSAIKAFGVKIVEYTTNNSCFSSYTVL